MKSIQTMKYTIDKVLLISLNGSQAKATHCIDKEDVSQKKTWSVTESSLNEGDQANCVSPDSAPNRDLWSI